ncbi:MAG: hypothetical protein JSS34_01250 [Proteobacteria bacterium]|nr:hypothetical protein [Pseudomonadota bacterium]
MMTIFSDPTFWTLIAFLFCIVFFGIKGFFFIKTYLQNQIVQIESHLKEAQNLAKDAENLFLKRMQESEDLKKTIKEIKKNSQQDSTFLSQETYHKIEDHLKRSEIRFQKRLKLIEEQAFLKIREEIADLIYEGSFNLLKKQQDKKSQRFFIKEALETLPQNIQRNT